MRDLIVIGAGPAGLAAAEEAAASGLKDILLIERDDFLGGILNQCIHNGFGLHYFKEELTGPEYAARFIDRLEGTSIETALGTMVLDISPDLTVTSVSKDRGLVSEKARAVILAMGCRERARGAIGIPGTRPAGIFTAGAAQRYVNIDGYMVGKRVVILGSGDIGLIMARRLTLEGAEVLACVEMMPFTSGLQRNISQCLNDFGIPLYLSHTVTEIRGKNRVEQVVVSEVDQSHRPIPGTETVYDCDTLLLSVGLIPENELTRKAGIEIDRRTKGAVVTDDMQTTLDGVFACGNVLQVHDLVDNVTAEAIRAGRSAAQYVLSGRKRTSCYDVAPSGSASYVVPQKIRCDAEGNVTLSFRVRSTIPSGKIELRQGDRKIVSLKRSDMTPGAMQQIVVPMKLMEGLNPDSGLTLDVGEA
ncbi:MAG: NAD(P)/FAD-dependent oxidoreductase [Oscillospiraceae bacterium]|jgi:NADPH-dependent 2,4-dienoyl-CoA reductase/sulfur reductase-like enzyme